jgi:predicted nucleic acid-binding protein
VTLADTSFLVALARQRETNHQAALEGLQRYGARDLSVPITVLSETMSLIGARWGRDAQRAYWRGVESSDIRILPVDPAAIAEAMRIDESYRDCGFGFVDATLLATCEALKDARILSFDRRLGAFRPSFAPALEVLP